MLKWSNDIVNQHFQSASKQMVPSDEMPNHRVGYDKAHCEPFDLVKTNQWVCTFVL